MDVERARLWGANALFGFRLKSVLALGNGLGFSEVGEGS